MGGGGKKKVSLGRKVQGRCTDVGDTPLGRQLLFVIRESGTGEGGGGQAVAWCVVVQARPPYSLRQTIKFVGSNSRRVSRWLLSTSSTALAPMGSRSISHCCQVYRHRLDPSRTPRLTIAQTLHHPVYYGCGTMLCHLPLPIPGLDFSFFKTKDAFLLSRHIVSLHSRGGVVAAQFLPHRLYILNNHQ